MSHNTCGHDPEERRIREAARWLMKLQQPNLSERQLLRWSKWQDSPENRAAFDSLEPIWRAIQPPRDHVEPISDLHAQPTKPVEVTVQKTSRESSKRLRLVSEEAAYWYFLCVDDSHLSRAQSREFLLWLGHSPENLTELLKIAELDDKLLELELVLRSLQPSPANVAGLKTSGSPPSSPHREISTPSGRARASVFKLAMFVASLLVSVALAFVAIEYWRAGQVIITGASQWHYMTLSDGTAVHIDARSKIEVAYTDDERIVHVYQGSAVFEVTKDPKRPFIARTHLIDAMAVGTRFEVSIDPGVTTTVSEGVVRVTGRGKSAGKAVLLKAGEELRVADSSLTAPQFAHVDAESKLRWADGLLDLSGMTVAEGAKQLNRRNRTQIVVESPALGARVITAASVKVDSPETYAKAVARQQGVTMILDKENNIIRLTE